MAEPFVWQPWIKSIIILLASIYSLRHFVLALVYLGDFTLFGGKIYVKHCELFANKLSEKEI